MKKILAEFIGTAVLVFVGCGAATMTDGIEGILGILGISFAFGLSLMAMIYAVGNVSGCHVNPAVSLAMLISGRMSVFDFIKYVIAQIAGAFAGAGLLSFVSGATETYEGIETSGLGENGFGDYSSTGLSMTGAIIVEIVLTFIFVLTILMVTKDESKSSVAGLVIGLALVVVHIIGIPLTGTSVNPARSLAPAVIIGITSDPDVLAQVWVFIVGPLAGGALAAVVYRLFNATREVEE